MTDAQLTALTTIAWIIGATTTFILLAHWSAAGSWGIASAIVRGAGGWSSRPQEAAHPTGDLPPMAAPRLDRLWGADHHPVDVDRADAPTAELEDLGSRRLR
jgi:hypothetical protein